jgi:hypothetical protein
LILGKGGPHGRRQEPYELADWSRKFGVSPEELKAAVARVGPMAKDVARALGKSL